MEKRSFQIISFSLWLLLSLSLNAELLDRYKKNPLILTPDPTFGKGVVWDDLFFNFAKEVVVAADGSIFVANVWENTFYKFTPEGQLIGTYGQEGLGPGDLTGPKMRSILDGKYLVIDEYALHRRISLFDLMGKYVKVVKMKEPSYNSIALHNNHIAYYTMKYPEGKNPNRECQARVFIKNLTTGVDTLVVSLDYFTKHIKILNGAYSCGVTVGEPFLVRTKDGQLLVGLSSTPTLKVYSIDGKHVQTIQLKMTPIKVTPTFIKEFKKQNLLDLKKYYPNSAYEFIESHVRHNSYESLFADYLPYYKQISIDPDGNLLIFKYRDSFDTKTNVMQVYRPDGQFVCESTVKTTGFDLGVGENMRTFQFTDQGIIGVFEMDSTDDDYHMKLMKLTIQ